MSTFDFNQIPETVLSGGNSPYRIIHIMHRSAGYLLDDHEHPFFHANYVLDGSVEICCRGTKILAKAGSLFILPPNVPHRLYSAEGYGQVGMDVQSNDDEKCIFELMQHVFGGQPVCMEMDYFREELYPFCLPLPAFSPLDKLRLFNLCERILLKALEIRQSRHHTPFQQNLLSAVSEADTCRLTVAELCARLYLSKTQLERLMHRDFGCSAGSYLNTHKLSRLYMLLAETDLSLDQIAEEAGFCDSSHLITFFKRHTGQTPAAFRKATR